MGMGKLVRQIKEKNDSQIRNFLIIFISGILIHLYAITNKFLNYFEMGNILADMSYSQQDTLGLGRWFLPIASNLLTDFSMPVFNGIVVMICLSAAAIMLIELLGINNMIYKCLFGIAWLSFPGLASVYSYGVNSDAMALTLLLSVLAVYVCDRFKFGYVAGSIILAFCIGIYQPYMSVTIAAVFVILFFETLKENFVQKNFIKLAVRYGLMLLIGFVLYYIILKLCLLLNNTGLSNYHGIDEMTSFTVKGILKGLVYSYGYFFANLFSKDYIYTTGRILCNCAGAISFFVCLWKLAGQKQKKKNQYLWMAIMCLLIPLGLNAAPFLMADRVGNGVDRYMLFSIVLLWGILLKLLEMIEDKVPTAGKKFIKVPYWIGVFSIVAMITSNIIICNQAYYRSETMTVATNSFMTRLAARMESVEGWNQELPVCFVNPRAMINNNYEVHIPKFDQLTNLPGTELKPWYSERAIAQYLEVYLNFPVNTVTAEQRETIESSKTVKQMPELPAAEAIQIIDGVMVVKISEE